MQKLLLDVDCVTVNGDVVKTLLICSGRVVVCPFSLYTALLIFDHGSISHTEIINRLFSADLESSIRNSALGGLERGSFFKTNSLHTHLGVQRNVYVKYLLNVCSEKQLRYGEYLQNGHYPESGLH